MRKGKKRRRRPLPLRFWIISAAILAILIFGIVKIIGLVKPILGFDEIKLKKTNEIQLNVENEESKIEVQSINGNIVLSNGKKIIFFNDNGDPLWEKNLTVSDPFIGGGENNIVVGDLETGQINFLDNKGNDIGGYLIGEPIYELKVNDDGNTLAILKSNMIYSIGNNGEEISSFKPPEGEIIDGSLSDNNGILALSILNTEEDGFHSNMIFYNNEGSIISGKKYENSIIYQLYFIDQDEVLAIGDNIILVLNKDNGVAWEKNFEETINKFDMSKEGIVAVNLIKNKSIILDTKNRTTVNKISKKGEILSKTPIAGDIQGIDIYNDKTLVYSDRTIFIIDKNGDIEIEKKVNMDIMEAWWITEDTIGVVYREEVHIFKIEQ